MSEENPNQVNSYITISRQNLLWLSGVIITIALIQIAGWNRALLTLGWLLLLIGATTIVLALRSYSSQDSSSLNNFLQLDELSHSNKWILLGSTLVAVGAIARFSPRDVAVFLCISGIIIMIYGVFTLSKYKHISITSIEAHSDPDFSNSNGYTKLSEKFRLQIAETLFRHAQRTSQLSFLVSLTFFIVGIASFIFVGYEILQFKTTDFEVLNFQQQPMVGFLLNRIEQDPAYIAPLSALLISLSAQPVIYLISLILVFWIGGRLILNATRLSRRKVIQESLAELGPLRSIFAGIPPRKPIQQVVDQSLQQTRRSLMILSWLSIILFGVGILLTIALAIYGFRTNFAEPLALATVGGSGLVSFIFSLAVNRNQEIRETLREITVLEREIAMAAQKSEIIDLYVAQLLQDNDKPPQMTQIQEAISLLLLQGQSGSGSTQLTDDSNPKSV